MLVHLIWHACIRVFGLHASQVQVASGPAERMHKARRADSFAEGMLQVSSSAGAVPACSLQIESGWNPAHVVDILGQPAIVICDLLRMLRRFQFRQDPGLLQPNVQLGKAAHDALVRAGQRLRGGHRSEKRVRRTSDI